MRSTWIASCAVTAALAAAVAAAMAVPPAPAAAHASDALQRRQGLLSEVWSWSAQSESPASTDIDFDTQGLIPPKWDTWFYQEIQGAMCADGSQAGIAYSLHPGATELVIYLSAGGGCWDTSTCFDNPRSTYLDGFNKTVFQQKWTGTLSKDVIITSRRPDLDNPWKKANYIFVPYCSGDFHAGSNTVTYDGAPAPIHHRGADNFRKILDWAVRAVPNMEHVWMAGTSAGCYGAVFNYVRAKKAFPQTRVHLMADSCVASSGWLGRRPTWKVVQPGGDDCPECIDGDFNSFLPALAKANPKSRFALLTFEVDRVLPFYADTTRDVLTSFLKQLRKSFEQVKTGMARTFTVAGAGHCVFYLRNAISAHEVPIQGWLTTLHDMTNDDAFRNAS